MSDVPASMASVTRLDALAAAWVVGVIAIGVAVAPSILELLRRREDPRPVATFRILVGVWLLCWLTDLIPLRTYLFTSEGVYPASEARGLPRLAPATAMDAVRALFGGTLTPLFWVDSPAVVDALLILLALATFAFTLGLFTPISKWLTLILFHCFVARNSLPLAGEQLYASFLLLLCLSDCGAAYGIDAWRARRRSCDGAPRRIPAWPRMLMVLQAVPMFFANGLAKTGEAWWRGDAIHLVLGNPRFGTLDASVWQSPAMEEGLRLATWGAHLIELLFPLAALGYFVTQAHHLGPLRRRRLVGGMLVVLGVLTPLLARAAWSDRELGWTLPGRLTTGYAVALVLAGVLVVRGRPLPAAWVSFARRWIVGWRVWVPLTVGLMGGIVLLTDVGWFPAVSMSTAVLLVERGTAEGPVLGEPPRPRRWERAREWAIVAFCTVHVLAVTWALMPGGRRASPWRRHVDVAAQRWLSAVRTQQVWHMFAPGVSRDAVYHEVWLRHRDGTRERIVDDVPAMSAPPKAPGRSKALKISRRLVDSDAWRALHLESVCRGWGRADDVVELWRMSYPLSVPRRIAGPPPVTEQLLDEHLCSTSRDPDHDGTR